MSEVKYRGLLTPVTIGGSVVHTARCQGPPSRLYPLLRDLATGEISMRNQSASVHAPHDAEHPYEPFRSIRPRVTIEVDTKEKRTIGVITGLKNGLKTQYLTLHEPSDGPRGYQIRTVGFTDIVAFRVLKVEVEDV